jgi:hypothetical protein
VRGHEVAKWREDRSRPSERGQVAEIERSRELGSSQSEAQVLGVQSREARGREAAKEREDRDRPLKRTRVRDLRISRTRKFAG